MGNGDSALAAAHAELAAVKATLADAQEKLSAVEAEAQRAQATVAVVPGVPGAAGDVQFSLLAGNVEIEISGSGVEATVRRRPAR